MYGFVSNLKELFYGRYKDFYHHTNFNEEKYIGECLESILNQTLKDIEIICINDGSTDKSLEILKKYKEKDDRINILNQMNSGAGVARNRGLNLAQGEYIGFIDGDDCFIDGDALERMFNLGKLRNSNMVSANIKHLTNNGLKDFDYINSIDAETVISPSNYGVPWFCFKNIFRKDFLMENNISFPNYRRGEDPVFLADILSKIDYITRIPVDYYGYRHVHDDVKLGSYIVDYFRHFIDVFRILNNTNFLKINEEYYRNFRNF